MLISKLMTVGVGHSRRYCNTGYDQSQGRRPSTHNRVFHDNILHASSASYICKKKLVDSSVFRGKIWKQNQSNNVLNSMPKIW